MLADSFRFQKPTNAKPETVRTDSWPLAGHELEGLVGGQSSLSCSGLRSHPSHARPPLEMDGGTTFYFVTEGIHVALDKARKAANGKDIRIGGGANIIQQYLREGLIDELHIAITPTILGGGERLFDGVDLRRSG